MPLEHGDAFEVANADWIRLNLPHYERVWGFFIGHNGNGWPLTIPGLSPEEEATRQKFYQAHYSVAVSARRMDKISSSIDQMEGMAQNYNEFETTHDLLFQFASRMGHIRDMFKIMGDSLGQKNIYRPLQGFYAQRSNILHGPSLPCRTQDGILCIPRIGGENEVSGEWASGERWSQMKPDKFIPIADFVHDTKDQFFRLIREAHGKISNAASICFNSRHVETPTTHSDASWNPAVGMVYTAVSACLPSSGNS